MPLSTDFIVLPAILNAHQNVGSHYNFINVNIVYYIYIQLCADKKKTKLLNFFLSHLFIKFVNHGDVKIVFISFIIFFKQLWQNVKRFNQHSNAFNIIYVRFGTINPTQWTYYVNRTKQKMYIQFIFNVTYLSNHENNLM